MISWPDSIDSGRTNALEDGVTYTDLNNAEVWIINNVEPSLEVFTKYFTNSD